MSQQSEQQLSSGQKVRHRNRPEWGMGTIVRAERITRQQQPTQRLTIRFANAGVKTMTAAQNELEVVEPAGEGAATNAAALDPFGSDEEAFDIWSALDSGGWLEPVARQKLDELMVSLPMPARDPFADIERRIAFTLDLYRFDRHGRGLVDWAVAQTGLDDPLGRFSRQELEAYFDRWAAARDAHLARLLHDARWDGDLINRAAAGAPKAGVDMVRQLTARR